MTDVTITLNDSEQELLRVLIDTALKHSGSGVLGAAAVVHQKLVEAELAAIAAKPVAPIIVPASPKEADESEFNPQTWPQRFRDMPDKYRWLRGARVTWKG